MYHLVLRLRSPLHIGWNKTGNVQRTRSYVTGRNLWGALTMRLTRDQAYRENRPPLAEDYQQMGKEIHQKLAYTYLYPAIKRESAYVVAFPWQTSDDASFERRFLRSYASTALSYPAQSATEGSLHEIEFLSPLTIDTGEPVYLIGYLFVHADMQDRLPAIKQALAHLQLGGERTYGWGRVELAEELTTCTQESPLFTIPARFSDGHANRPRIHMHEGQPLFAHTEIAGVHAEGEVEPLVGREWRGTESKHRYVGQFVHCNGVCFAPGSILTQASTFEIGTYGVWKQT
jgi:hypothetical protein